MGVVVVSEGIQVNDWQSWECPNVSNFIPGQGGMA